MKYTVIVDNLNLFYLLYLSKYFHLISINYSKKILICLEILLLKLPLAEKKNKKWKNSNKRRIYKKNLSFLNLIVKIKLNIS